MAYLILSKELSCLSPEGIIELADLPRSLESAPSLVTNTIRKQAH